MKFAILYNIDYQPSVHGSSSQYYGEILEQVQLIERLGYDAVWFGEHHYSGYSFGAPAVIATAAADRTDRLRIGTGVSLVPLHHPLVLAEEYAMLDVLSNGRLEYGIGRGFLSLAYEVLNVDKQESVDRYREGTELLIKAWSSEGPFSFQGKFWQLNNYRFSPKPVQQPHPPIYSAGTQTQESYLWAASKGLNLCTAFFIPNKQMVADNIRAYRQALSQCGYDASQREVVGVVPMYCGESREEARRHGGQYVLNYFKFFGDLDRVGSQRGSAEGYEEMTFEYLDNAQMIFVGDPEALIERIQWAREYYACDYFMFEASHGGAPHEHVVNSLERFAKDVMPHFREPSLISPDPRKGPQKP